MVNSDIRPCIVSRWRWWREKHYCEFTETIYRKEKT